MFFLLFLFACIFLWFPYNFIGQFVLTKCSTYTNHLLQIKENKLFYRDLSLHKLENVEDVLYEKGHILHFLLINSFHHILVNVIVVPWFILNIASRSSKIEMDVSQTLTKICNKNT